MTTPTQAQLFYRASQQASEADQLFLSFVQDGLTREELEKNIQRRPALWSRYSAWLDKLPSSKSAA